MAFEKHDVAIQELSVGECMQYDVLDASGIVLLRNGQLLSQEVIDGWMRRGFARVVLSREAPARKSDRLAEAESARLVRPYDAELLEEIDRSVAKAKRAVDQILLELAYNEEADMRGLDSVIDGYINALSTDTDAVLSRTGAQKSPSENVTNERLMIRSIKMAVLGAATATTMGLSRSECRALATAGMLHDMSLYEETLSALLNTHPSIKERSDVFFRHALHSAELFSQCQGISDFVRIVITQVHEQVDGNGFPRGLLGHHMNVLSRILNIVDAFLTLTDPEPPQPAYVASDALAYLLNQAGYGAFDRECMRAFVATLSVYPIGSKVELSTSQTATVMRSTPTDPLRPIVRIDGGPAMVDLRQANITIERPVLEDEFPHRQRMPRSHMESVLWKPAFLDVAD